jgi:hypothetical protein
MQRPRLLARCSLEVHWHPATSLSAAFGDKEGLCFEAALLVIPIGRKSRVFCWTEHGPKHVNNIQSLIVAYRQHGVDPYAYLVDILQRVAEHPASRQSVSLRRVRLLLIVMNPGQSPFTYGPTP